MKLTAILAVGAIAAFAACTKDSASTADTAAAMADTSAMTMPADTQAPAATTAAAPGGMMDPNSASETDLATIPGVTPQVATSIASGRPYANNVALNKVLTTSNLTEQQRDSVFARLWTPIDINTATDDEILLIPGVGSRMLREFKEYRPYSSIDQFRREIGKYVDDAELARLERFVVIR